VPTRNRQAESASLPFVPHVSTAAFDGTESGQFCADFRLRFQVLTASNS